MVKTISFKTTVRNLYDYYTKTFTDYYGSLKALNWPQFSARIISNLLICISFALFCSLKEGTGALYMNVFLPVFFANTIIILYACVNHSSDLFALLTVFLTTTGTALQIFMLPASNENSLLEVKKYVYILLLGIIAAICIVPLLKFLCLNDNLIETVIGLLFAATIVVYFVLLIFGKEIRGTKAWIGFGSFSFQLTEISKILAFVSIPFIILDKKRSEKTKSIMTLSLLCIHAVFLVLLNELGTLCMILLVSFLVRMIFAFPKKYVVREVVAVILLAAVAFAGCFGIYKLTAYDGNRNEVIQQQTSESAITADGDAVAAADENQSDAQAAQAAMRDGQTNSSASNKVLSRLARIYPKIVQRVKVFLKSKDVPQEDLYQIRRAEDALLAVSFFGTPRGSLSMVPEIDSDFVFIYLLVRLGVVGAMLVFAAFIAMLIEVVVKGALIEGNHILYMTAFAFISSIALQALLCSCSNIGLFPIIGLPFPFLSHGGAALCMNLFMSLFIISCLGKNQTKEMSAHVTAN